MSDLVIALLTGDTLTLYGMNGHGAALELANLRVVDRTPGGIVSLVEGLRPFLAAQPAVKRGQPAGAPRGRKPDRAPLSTEAVREYIATHPGTGYRAIAAALGYHETHIASRARKLVDAGAIVKRQAYRTDPVKLYLPDQAPDAVPPPDALPSAERAARARAYVAEHPGATTREVLAAAGLSAASSSGSTTQRFVNYGLRYEVEPGVGAHGKYRWFVA